MRLHLAFALIGGLLVGVIAVVAVRTALVSRHIRPTPNELGSARARGIASLAALAHRYPKDPRVVVELAKVQFAAGGYSGSVSSVARALTIEPKTADDAEVASLLWKSVQKRESGEATFKLLE